VTVLVGSDAGAVAQLAARLPALLLESGYSRAFEREADLYACRALTRLGVGPEPLARALERLAAEPSGGASLPSWVSSHPDTDERVAAVRACGP
jgi:Zn-dependent protease with chaperone function